MFQLARGDQNDAFELSFDTDLMHLVVITGADRWETGAVQNVIAQSNMGDVVTVAIEAASSADPGTIYQGPDIHMRFSRDSPDGPLYFWSAATNGIMRGAIGASFAGKLYPGDSTCVGCHTLSRDGSRMAMGWGGEAVSALQTVDVQTLATTISQSKLYEMGWATYSPDGTLLLIASNGVLVMRDATTGLPINSPTGKVALPVGHYATHPEWSPDGKYVAIAYTATPTEQRRRQDREHRAARVRSDDEDVRRSGDPRAGNGRRQLLLPEVLARRLVPRVCPRDRAVARCGIGRARADRCEWRHDDLPRLPRATRSRASSVSPALRRRCLRGRRFKASSRGSASRRRARTASCCRRVGEVRCGCPRSTSAHEVPGVDPSAAGFWLPCQDPTVVNNTPIWAPAAVMPQ